MVRYFWYIYPIHNKEVDILMRVSTGLLLALWIIFMGYKFFTTEPVGGSGEFIRTLGGMLIFFQLIAWAFVFTQPIVTFNILLILSIISLLIAIGGESSYFIFVVVNSIFAGMSYAGHKELIKEKKAKRK